MEVKIFNLYFLELGEKISLGVVPHALCAKSGWDFADEDNQTYDDWYLATTELIRNFLMTQYAALSARL